MDKPMIVIQNICNSCRSEISRKANKGKPKSEAHVEKMSEITKKLFQDPEFRQKHLEGQSRRYFIDENGKRIIKDPEARKKRSLDSKEQWKDPEFRERKIAFEKERWSDPKLKKEQSKRIKKLWKDPEFRKKKSEETTERLTKLWQDPEYREKMTTGLWTEEKRKEASEKKKKQYNGKNMYNLRKVYTQSSKPEQELFLLVKQVFPDAKQKQSVETKKTRRFPDILIENKKLIIEYDGSYWHDKKEDRKRDRELKKAGYSIIHYVDRIPTIDELKTDITNFI